MTVYHIPTYRQFQAAKQNAAPVMGAGPHSQRDDKRLIEILVGGGDLHLRGEAAEIVGNMALLGEKVQIVGEAAGVFHLLSESVESANSVAAPIVSSVGAACHLLSDREFGDRVSGVRAVAYGITWWAFGGPRPGLPAQIRAN